MEEFKRKYNSMKKPDYSIELMLTLTIPIAISFSIIYYGIKKFENNLYKPFNEEKIEKKIEKEKDDESILPSHKIKGGMSIENIAFID